MSNIIDSIRLSGTTYQIQGGSITVDTALDSGSTNPVQNRVIYNKIDEVEEVTAAGLNALDAKINPTIELTQAQYDALTEKDPNTYYIITDAQAGDLTNYYTKSETNTLLSDKADTATTYTKTETNTLLSDKADTATTYTKTEVDNAITAATSTKQDTLVSGTNIKTINNTSILGSGNIDIQGGGGGKTIEAGRGISITTGETADTVSFDLPIYKTVSGTDHSLVLNAYSEPSAYTFKAKSNVYINCIKPYVDDYSGGNNLIMGESCSAMSYAAQSFVGGLNSKIGDSRTFAFGARSEALHVGAVAFGYDGQYFKPQVSKGNGSFACGGGTSANTAYSFATGYHNFTSIRSEFASGQYNNSVSATTTFGDSGNTLFSVGNGTADNARHNAFEIRQNGDIYLTLDGQDVKLQDQLRGGGASYTAGDGIDITNDVISVTGKVDTSDNNVSAFSGVPLAINVSENYDSLQLKTIYIKNNDATQHTNVVFGAIKYYNGSYMATTDISGSSTLSSGITAITNTDTTAHTFTLENGVCRIDFLGSCYFSRIDSEGDGFSFYYIHNNNYTSGQTSTVIENTVYDALTELGKDIVDMNDSGRFVNVSKAQDITGQKNFIGDKGIKFSQKTSSNKPGFVIYAVDTANTTTEAASFEFRPNTFRIDGVQHPLLYFGHYRTTTIANKGIPQTVVGFRQYDQLNAAAYHYLMPLPEKAKTPFSLTTSFKDYYAPMGFKNGSTMITADNTGVVDLSSELGGLKLVKLTQSEYDALATKDNSTLYIVTDS